MVMTVLEVMLYLAVGSGAVLTVLALGKYFLGRPDKPVKKTSVNLKYNPRKRDPSTVIACLAMEAGCDVVYANVTDDDDLEISIIGGPHEGEYLIPAGDDDNIHLKQLDQYRV